jgi:RNA polymerase sigma-70 factor (ECF subfamily)
MGNENRYDGLDEYAVKLIRHKARQLVGRAGFVEADRHDLEQDMAVDLLRRLPRFDPRLAKRETFIARIVEHRVATILEAQRAGVRDYRRCARSLDERRTYENGETSDGPPLLDQAEYLRETLAVLGATLSIVVDHGVPVFFCGDRQLACRFVEGLLCRYHRRVCG